MSEKAENNGKHQHPTTPDEKKESGSSVLPGSATWQANHQVLERIAELNTHFSYIKEKLDKIDQIKEKVDKFDQVKEAVDSLNTKGDATQKFITQFWTAFKVSAFLITSFTGLLVWTLSDDLDHLKKISEIAKSQEEIKAEQSSLMSRQGELEKSQMIAKERMDMINEKLSDIHAAIFKVDQGKVEEIKGR